MENTDSKIITFGFYLFLISHVYSTGKCGTELELDKKVNLNLYT